MQIIRETLKRINDLSSIEYHRSIAKQQRTAYNYLRSDPNLLENKIMIELDYKSKVRLGVVPRQPNNEFYLSQKKVSCLGFGIYYVDKDTQQTKCLDIDIISDYEG